MECIKSGKNLNSKIFYRILKIWKQIFITSLRVICSWLDMASLRPISYHKSCLGSLNYTPAWSKSEFRCISYNYFPRNGMLLPVFSLVNFECSSQRQSGKSKLYSATFINLLYSQARKLLYSVKIITTIWPFPHSRENFSFHLLDQYTVLWLRPFTTRGLALIWRYIVSYRCSLEISRKNMLL